MNYKYIFVYSDGEFNNEEFGVGLDRPLSQDEKIKIKQSILNKTWPNFNIDGVKILEAEET